MAMSGNVRDFGVIAKRSLPLELMYDGVRNLAWEMDHRKLSSHLTELRRAAIMGTRRYTTIMLGIGDTHV